LTWAEFKRDFRFHKYGEYIGRLMDQGADGSVVKLLQDQRDAAWSEDCSRLETLHDEAARKRAAEQGPR
jgi:hypothetical protein